MALTARRKSLDFIKIKLALPKSNFPFTLSLSSQPQITVRSFAILHVALPQYAYVELWHVTELETFRLARSSKTFFISPISVADIIVAVVSFFAVTSDLSKMATRSPNKKIAPATTRVALPRFRMEGFSFCCVGGTKGSLSSIAPQTYKNLNAGVLRFSHW